MTDLLDQGAAAISSAIRAGKTSARDVAEAAIARVEAKNKAITAIVDFDPAEARAAADAVDGRRKQGFDGPILGVPYTVKDTTWVQGRRVTNGSLLWKDFKPPRDAVAVERLKAAGGVFLGMTNTPEMAAKGHTENKVYGPSRHPMNPALTPGGSSGGAAAACLKWGSRPLQPPRLRWRQAGASAPRRSQPRWTMVTVVVAWPAKEMSTSVARLRSVPRCQR
jgi:aspartyl-tRNA(Asn)/glutamyl-tRNA(Gln) amidotransferase subunit A